MKNYILTIALLAVSYIGFAQVSTNGQYRIANRGVATIGINLPIGSQIYVASDSSLWVVTHPLASGSTVAAAYAAGKLDLVNNKEDEGKLTVKDSLNGLIHVAKIHSNTVNSNDVKIVGGTGVSITTDSNSVITITNSTSGTWTVKSFEEATGGSGSTFALTESVLSLTAIKVELNGMPLTQDAFGYSVNIGTGLITLTIPDNIYDKVTVAYVH